MMDACMMKQDASALVHAARGGKPQDLLGIVGKIAQRPRHLQTALSLVYECARAHCANASSVGGMVPPLSSLDGSSSHLGFC
jgi:hypothetical protein